MFAARIVKAGSDPVECVANLLDCYNYKNPNLHMVYEKSRIYVELMPISKTILVFQKPF